MLLRYRVAGGERLEDSAIPVRALLCRLSCGYDFRRTAPAAAVAVHAAARVASGLPIFYAGFVLLVTMWPQPRSR